jgi:hypothetical protein
MLDISLHYSVVVAEVPFELDRGTLTKANITYFFRIILK